MTHDQVEKSWRDGKPLPVYVFYGEEDFLRSELIHLAPGLFLPDLGTRSFNYDLLYGAETNIGAVITMAQGYPMMADRRLVVVRDAERVLKAKPATEKKKGKGNNEDPLLHYLEHPNPDCILIFDMAKMGPRNTSPFKQLAEKAMVVEFAEMKDGEVATWLRARAKKMGKTLTEGAARLMVGHLGINLRTHANELEKLITFVGEAKQELSEEDIERVVGVSRNHNVFELTKAIGTGNRALAIEIALRMIAQDKDSKQMLLVMLARFLEQLTIARELINKGESERAIAEALELRGGAAYFVKETMSFARKYTRERLDRAMRALVDAEAQTRRLTVDDALMFETLLLDLMPG